MVSKLFEFDNKGMKGYKSTWKQIKIRESNRFYGQFYVFSLNLN